MVIDDMGAEESRDEGPSRFWGQGWKIGEGVGATDRFEKVGEAGDEISFCGLVENVQAWKVRECGGEWVGGAWDKWKAVAGIGRIWADDGGHIRIHIFWDSGMRRE